MDRLVSIAGQSCRLSELVNLADVAPLVPCLRYLETCELFVLVFDAEQVLVLLPERACQRG